MNRRMVFISAFVILLGNGAFLSARDKNPKPGPLAGTWECTSHGGSHGDFQFTLTLEQDKDTVTGYFTSPIGSSELSDATYDKKTLEIHIQNDQDDCVLTARLKGNKLSGDWTHGAEKGSWEGSKQPPASK